MIEEQKRPEKVKLKIPLLTVSSVSLHGLAHLILKITKRFDVLLQITQLKEVPELRFKSPDYAQNH